LWSDGSDSGPGDANWYERRERPIFFELMSISTDDTVTTLFRSEVETIDDMHANVAFYTKA